MDGNLRLMQRELQMREQAVGIRIIHQGEFFVAVDSNLGAVVGEKEAAVTSIPGKRVQNHPGLGKCAWRYESFCCILMAFGGMGPKKRSPLGGGAEESQNH